MEEDIWPAAYAANEAINVDNSADADVKANAWRVQKLLLAHATRELSDANHNAILKQHQEKWENSASASETFMQLRLAACQVLLGKSHRRQQRAELTKMHLDWQLPGASFFEQRCCGEYESCQHNEIIIEDLQSSTRATATAMQTAGTATAMQNAGTATATPTTAETPTAAAGTFGFCTAREQLMLHNIQKKQQRCVPRAGISAETGVRTGIDAEAGSNNRSANDNASNIMNFKKKSLGGKGRGVNAKFVQPTGQQNNNDTVPPAAPTVAPVPELASLSHLDPVMVEQIMRESMHKYKAIDWSDIAGLEYAKSTFMETIIHPLQRPDLFKGVRRPPRGVLLFGPPGTGKTLIAKCIASQAKATFFSINPSSLTSKWVGEGEKLVKTLFAVAAEHQPAIIFMDEVDSLLSQRSDNEHESSRRLKNEFFIQLDGAATNDDDLIIIIGATNRPQELDEAVRRRFVRRLYVALPGTQARHEIISKLVKQVHHNLTAAQIQGLAELTEGYSGADMDSLCRYAAMQPLRTLSSSEIDIIEAQQLPPVTMSDFMTALQHVSKSVSADDVQHYVNWNKMYGSKS